MSGLPNDKLRWDLRLRLQLRRRSYQLMRLIAPKVDAPLGDHQQLPRPRLFILITVGVLLCLLVWSWFAKIDMVVRGAGRIVASEHNQVIQHLEGGIVSAILVREGAAVKKGQTLISIADVRANADLGEGNVKILGLRARVARAICTAPGGSRRSRQPPKESYLRIRSGATPIQAGA